MYIHVCVLVHICMYYTHTPSLEKYARKLLKDIAFARGTLGDRTLFTCCGFFVFFLNHLNVFAYSKIHRYVYT